MFFAFFYVALNIFSAEIRHCRTGISPWKRTEKIVASKHG